MMVAATLVFHMVAIKFPWPEAVWMQLVVAAAMEIAESSADYMVATNFPQLTTVEAPVVVTVVVVGKTVVALLANKVAMKLLRLNTVPVTSLGVVVSFPWLTAVEAPVVVMVVGNRMVSLVVNNVAMKLLRLNAVLVTSLGVVVSFRWLTAVEAPVVVMVVVVVGNSMMSLVVNNVAMKLGMLDLSLGMVVAETSF